MFFSARFQTASSVNVKVIKHQSVKKIWIQNSYKTMASSRMHSSRMCTGHSLTACWSLFPGGVSAPWGCAPEGVWSEGCLLWGFVCSGGCLLQGGVCSGVWGGWEGVWSWGVSGPRGSTLGGICSGGCLLWGVWYPSINWCRHPPVNRMTDRCKNITLATTSLQPVKMMPITSMLTT